MAERLKLTVVQVKDVQKVGEKQKEKLTFLARGEDGKELSFSTMRTSLFDAIRNNKEIEADVEVTEKDTYINRYVSQVYVDGKAIATEGKWQGGGRQWGGKSPEEIASIETQTAVKVTAELVIAGVLLLDSYEGLGLRRWLQKRLPMGESAKPLSKASATEGATKPLEDDVPKSEDIDMSPVKNKGDLFTRCLKYHNLTKSQALDKMGGRWEVDLVDLDAAWQQVCAVMKEKEE